MEVCSACHDFSMLSMAQRASLRISRYRYEELSEMGVSIDEYYDDGHRVRIAPEECRNVFEFLLRSFLSKFNEEDRMEAFELFLELKGFRDLRKSIHHCTKSFEGKLVGWLGEILDVMEYIEESLTDNMENFQCIMSILCDTLISNSDKVSTLGGRIASTLLDIMLHNGIVGRDLAFEWTSNYGILYLLTNGIHFKNLSMVKSILAVFQRRQSDLFIHVLPSIGRLHSNMECPLQYYLGYIKFLLLDQSEVVLNSKPFKAELCQDHVIRRLLNLCESFNEEVLLDLEYETIHDVKWFVDEDLRLSKGIGSLCSCLLLQSRVLEIMSWVQRVFPEEFEISQDQYICTLAKLVLHSESTYIRELLIANLTPASLSAVSDILKTTKNTQLQEYICHKLGHVLTLKSSLFDLNLFCVRLIHLVMDKGLQREHQSLDSVVMDLVQFLLMRSQRLFKDEDLLFIVDSLSKLVVENLHAYTTVGAFVEHASNVLQWMLCDSKYASNPILKAYRLALLKGLIGVLLKLKVGHKNYMKPLKPIRQSTALENADGIRFLIVRLTEFLVRSAHSIVPQEVEILFGMDKSLNKLLSLAVSKAQIETMEKCNFDFELMVNRESLITPCLRLKHTQVVLKPICTIPSEIIRIAEPSPEIIIKQKKPKVNTKKLLENAQLDIDRIKIKRMDNQQKAAKELDEALKKQELKHLSVKSSFDKMHSKWKSSARKHLIKDLQREEIKNQYLDLKETSPCLERLLEADIAKDLADWHGMKHISSTIANEVARMTAPYLESLKRVFQHFAKAGSTSFSSFDDMRHDNESLSSQEWLQFLQTFEFVPQAMQVSEALGIFNRIVVVGTQIGYLQFLQGLRLISQQYKIVDHLWVSSGYDCCTSSFSPSALKIGWLDSKRSFSARRSGACPNVLFSVVCEQLRNVASRDFRVGKSLGSWPKRQQVLPLNELNSINPHITMALDIVGDIVCQVVGGANTLEVEANLYSYEEELQEEKDFYKNLQILKGSKFQAVSSALLPSDFAIWLKSSKTHVREIFKVQPKIDDACARVLWNLLEKVERGTDTGITDSLQKSFEKYTETQRMHIETNKKLRDNYETKSKMKLNKALYEKERQSRMEVAAKDRQEREALKLVEQKQKDAETHEKEKRRQKRQKDLKRLLANKNIDSPKSTHSKFPASFGIPDALEKEKKAGLKPIQNVIENEETEVEIENDLNPIVVENEEPEVEIESDLKPIIVEKEEPKVEMEDDDLKPLSVENGDGKDEIETSRKKEIKNEPATDNDAESKAES